MTGGLINLFSRAVTLLIPCIFSSALYAVDPPAGVLTAKNNIGVFDGSTGVLNSCVALKDANGNTQNDGNGVAQIFNVALILTGPGLVFEVTSATPFDIHAGKDCSGIFKDGVYQDSVLIQNTDPALNGSVLNLKMDHIPDTNLKLQLRGDFSRLGGVTFQFSGSTSQADRQLIEDTVLFSSDFMHAVLGRTLQQGITITTSSTAAGCANGGGSAFTGPRSMTICSGNTGWTVHGPVNKKKILLHEMFHLLQFEQRWIGGPHAAGPHWLVEGAAEYIGWLGIAALGDITMATARGCMVKEVADFSLQQPPGLPNLNALETGQSFQRPGPVYALSMLGADQLVANSNLNALLNFGQSISGGSAINTGFESAFATSLGSFYGQFPAYRSALAVPAAYNCRL